MGGQFLGRRGPKPEPYRRPERPGEWWIRWTEPGPDGKPVRRTRCAGKDKAAAQRLLDGKLADLERRRLGFGRKVTLASFAATDLAPVLRARLRPRSYEAVAARVLTAAAHFGDRPVGGITRQDAEGFLGSLDVAPLTVRNYRAALAVAWKVAIDRKAAHDNPWRGVSVPRAQERAVPFLDESQLRRVYAAMPADLRPLVVLLGETALRLGEGLGLRWEDVAGNLSRVTIRRSKTGKSREVPLTVEAQAVLREMRRGADRTGLVFPGLHRTGHPDILHPTQRAHWRKAVTRCGHGSLRVNDLRHARASLLVRAGVPVPTVSRWLGHSTPALVLTRYGMHAPANELDLALERLATARAAPRPKRRRSAGTASGAGSRRGRRR